MLKIFIGLIFIFFSLKIQNFDLSVDFAGYILIYLGLKEYPDIVAFRKAKPITIVMLAISLAVTILSIFVTEGNEALSFILIPMAIVTSVSVILMSLFIAKGITELEQKTGLNLNSRKLMSVWKKHTVLMVLGTFLALSLVMLAMNNGFHSLLTSNIDITQTATVLSVISGALALGAIIISIIYLVYIHRARKALDNYHPKENVPEEFIFEHPQQTDDE